jgi:outer membrane protein TolC
VSEKDIANAMNLAYSGGRYGYFLQNNRQYYIIGQVAREDRNVPADISSLYVRSASGNMIQLDNIVSIKENSNPPVLYHYNRYKSATVSANLADGKTLGQGIAEMQRISDKLLDSSFTTALNGPSRDFAESNSNISFALILALLLIYLILAAQFESFRDPFIIMITVPMAIAGAMLSLWIFNQTLNIFSEIGMIMLIGIVTKNGILIVEFANQKRKLGMNKRVAAFEAAAARFRPILMTSLATIFGALPIAFALGAGASSRVSLGIVVVFGLLFSLILTLFVIPVFYIINWKKIIVWLMKILNMVFRFRFIFVLILAFFSFNINAQKTLTIDDAISTALKNNFDILVAGNDANVTKVNNTPGNAGMLPTFAITGSGNYGLSNTTQKLSSGLTNNYPDLSATSLSAGAQLNWNLYDGGKMFVTKSKLNEIQALGEIQYKEKVLQTLYNVIAAYYDVVRQKQQLNSINEVLNFNKERVILAQAGLNAGSLVKTDVLQAKIDLNVTTENAINQQFAIDATLKTLNILLGGKASDLFDTSDSIPLNYSPDKASLLQKIEKSNTSILNLQKQIDIAQLALRENKSLYLPTFSMKAGYYASQSINSNGSILQNTSLGPQIGGTLVVPIYSAGETKRKIAIAKIQTETAQLDLESIKLQLNTELQNTLIDFENQQKLLKIESENNELAKENIQISMDRLKHGQTNSLEVHQAQESYVQSSTRLINFRYNLKIAETKLKQMVSEL